MRHAFYKRAIKLKREYPTSYSSLVLIPQLYITEDYIFIIIIIYVKITNELSLMDQYLTINVHIKSFNFLSRNKS